MSDTGDDAVVLAGIELNAFSNAPLVNFTLQAASETWYADFRGAKDARIEEA
jgi:hypothetical protein